MRNSGKQSAKPIQPSPGPAILPVEPATHDADKEHGEGSYRGTGDYQTSLKRYLETANVAKDARAAAPNGAAQARELAEAEKKGRRPGIKTKRPANGK